MNKKVGVALLRTVRNIDRILTPLEQDTRRPDDHTLKSIRAILLRIEQMARNMAASKKHTPVPHTLFKEIAQRLQRLDALGNRPRGVLVYGDIKADC